MKPILMSAENPTGHKLDVLVSQLMLEILDKNKKIVHDQSEEARMVFQNNIGIIEYLTNVRDLQIGSMECLDLLAENEGPNGNPRIGVSRTYDMKPL